MRYDTWEMPDLELPLLHDHHSHVSLYAALDGCPDISQLDKARAMLLLKSLPEDRLSTVLGWYSAHLSFTDDELAGLPPVLIVNYSLHGLLLSAGARELLKDSDPELVERHGDVEWCERNLAALLAVYVRSAGLTREKLGRFMKKLEGLGIGSTEDMVVTGEEPLKVIRSSPFSGRIRCWADPATYRFSPGVRKDVVGLKFFLDGALGLRTAAMKGPGTGGGGKGLLLNTEEELLDKLESVARLGLPTAIHALGGRAIEQVLTCLETLDREKAPSPRARLEHVQFIDEGQARRAKKLGLTLSMQPNFSADSRDYSDRLTPEARAANNPFRMLIDRAGFVPGADLVFGSDGMPHGVHVALRWGLFPDHEGQRLTVPELEAGFGPALGGGGACRFSVDEAQRRVELV